MPALPDVAQTLRVDFIHSLGPDHVLGNRTFWHYTGGAPSDGDLNTLAADVATQWSVNLAPMADANVTLTQVVITDLTNPSAGRGDWVGSHTGTRSGTGLTTGTCLLLNFQIGRRYRGGKPRIYCPWGVEEDLANPSTWDGAFVTASETAWTNFTSDFTGASVGSTVVGGQENVSYYKGFASVQNPVTLRWANIPTPRSSTTPDAIVSHTANPIVGSQRRRFRA